MRSSCHFLCSLKHSRTRLTHYLPTLTSGTRRLMPRVTSQPINPHHLAHTLAALSVQHTGARGSASQFCEEPAAGPSAVLSAFILHCTSGKLPNSAPSSCPQPQQLCESRSATEGPRLPPLTTTAARRVGPQKENSVSVSRVDPSSEAWPNTVAICATMTDAHADDVIEWLQYHRCSSCSADSPHACICYRGACLAACPQAVSSNASRSLAFGPAALLECHLSRMHAMHACGCLHTEHETNSALLGVLVGAATLRFAMLRRLNIDAWFVKPHPQLDHASM
jgi:hypothetical protein